MTVGTYGYSFTGSIVHVTVGSGGIVGGTYDITAYGAQGGSGNGGLAGLGAKIGGVITLATNEVLEIVVGGAGVSNAAGGGGGGSFVLERTGAPGTYAPLVIAGGGGGGAFGSSGTYFNGSGLPGVTTTAGGAGKPGGGGAGGTPGNGGNAGGGHYGGGGGSGLVGAGGASLLTNAATGGAGFVGGAAGGLYGSGNGGFGGGGGGSYHGATSDSDDGPGKSGYGGGGGGGGYSGGGGGYNPGTGNRGGGGGGGGSYDSGSSQVKTAGQHGGNGLVTFVLIPPGPTVTSVTTGGTGITAGAGDLGANATVIITVNMSATVTVTGGTPTLTLSSGGTATYTGGSGSSALTFSYTVVAGQNTSDLTVTALNLGTATIKDAGNNNIVTASAVTNPAGTLVIDTTAPTVSTVVASGTNIVSGGGDLGVGATVTFTVNMSEAVTVAGGVPTLTLSDGGSATYASGSGSTALIFQYTVGGGQTSADLTVTAFNPGTATIRDGAGNNAVTTGAVTNPTGTLQIDTTAPTVTSVATSGSGVTSGNGDLPVGAGVIFTLNFSEVVTVVGTPTLTLNDGGTATYASGSGTAALTFNYTVITGQSTPDLAVTAVNLGAATIRDAAGNNANIAGVATNPTGTLQIDAIVPTVTSVTTAGTGISGGTGDLGLSAQVTFTVNLSETVTVAGGVPTLTLNDGGTATYASGSGSSTLTFVYTVGASQNTSDLTVTAVNLNSATIRDAAGNNANTSGAATNPTGTLQIDTTPPPTPLITSPALSNLAAPTIIGTAEAGAIVTVTVAGAVYTTVATGGAWSVNLASAGPTSGTLVLNDNGTNSVSVTATDLAGNMSVDPATQTLTIMAPTIAGTVANQGVPNQTTSHPFAPASVVDAAVGSNAMTVTLSAPGNGTFSNLSGGSYNASTGVYGLTGTPSVLTAALQGLVFTPIAQSGVNVVTTGFTIALTTGGAVDSVTTVTAVQQVLGLAEVPINQIVISVSPDGSSFAAAQPSKTNEAVITNPLPGHTYLVPTGYQALYLGGTAGATLSDTAAGNAYLVANSGADTLIANAANDVLVAGSGTDSLFGGAFASTVAGGSGAATVFAGTGVIKAIEGSGSLVFGGNNNAGSSVFGGTGDNPGNLATNLTGLNQTVSVGASTATVTVSGSGGNVIGGTAALTVTMSGSANTVQAGSGSNTVFSNGSGNVILGGSVSGSGSSQILETGSNDTIHGGVNAMAVTATGATQVFGGSGSLAFLGGSGVSSVVGGTGATSVSAGTGGVVLLLSSSVTAAANSGTGAVTVFGASGVTVNLTGGSGKDYLVAGSGSETLNASASSSSNWLSVASTVTSGSAMLIAGSGNDTLIAGGALGSTTMTGGSGTDAFVFFRQAVGGARDAITNFAPNDSIYIEGYGAGSAGALLSAATVGPGGLTLTLSDSTTITFSSLTDRTALIGRIQYG